MLGTLGSRLIGVTPVLKESRHSEILGVVERQPNVPYVILDDDPSQFPQGCPELLLCNPLIGIDKLTMKELERRIQVARRTP